MSTAGGWERRRKPDDHRQHHRRGDPDHTELRGPVSDHPSPHRNDRTVTCQATSTIGIATITRGADGTEPRQTRAATATHNTACAPTMAPSETPRASSPWNGKNARIRPPGATSDATRARILRAARQCFARAGYANTTNKQIADLAGITSAAIYQYFDSKTALYMATARDAQAELVPEFRAVIEAETSTRSAFRALLAVSARQHERDPSLSAFLSALPVEMRREESIARAMATTPSEVLEIIQTMVARGVRAGEIARADSGRVVAVFLACTMGLSLYAATIESSDFVATMDAFLALLDGGLVRDRARKRRRPSGR
jgi:AcrR family transcriptional regulator